MAILSILPQNLVYLPLIIIWAVVGVNFSVYLARGRQDRTLSLGTGLMGYTLLMLLFLGLIFVGAFIEAYLCPWFLRLFV